MNISCADERSSKDGSASGGSAGGGAGVHCRSGRPTELRYFRDGERRGEEREMQGFCALLLTIKQVLKQFLVMDLYNSPEGKAFDSTQSERTMREECCTYFYPTC